MAKYWICWKRLRQYCMLTWTNWKINFARNRGNHKESSCIILNRFPKDSTGKDPPVKQWKWESLGQSGKTNYKIYAHETNTEWNKSGEIWCRLLTVELRVFQREFFRQKIMSKIYGNGRKKIRQLIKFVVNIAIMLKVQRMQENVGFFLYQYIFPEQIRSTFYRHSDQGD